jgi:hypothetical protein
MSELNEKGTLPPGPGDAFKGAPEHTRYEAGTKFYKVGTRQEQVEGARGSETFNSPWWVPEDEYKRMQIQADRMDKPVGDVARSRVAVKEEWNPAMSDVTEMTLKEPVWGWQGQAKHQTEPSYDSPDAKPEDQGKVNYMGGAQQTYLPGLAADKQGMRSDHAYISRYEAAEATPYERQRLAEKQAAGEEKGPHTRDLGSRPGSEQHPAEDNEKQRHFASSEAKTRDLGERPNRDSGEQKEHAHTQGEQARRAESVGETGKPPVLGDTGKRSQHSSSADGSLTSDDRSKMKEEMVEKSKPGRTESKDKER